MAVSNQHEPEYETEGISDPTDYKQRHRIQSILEARQFVIEQRHNALDKELYGEVSQELADRMVRVAVEDYILESEHKIKEHLPDDPDSVDYTELSGESKAAVDAWYLLELGVVELENTHYEFQGLESFIDAPRALVDYYVVEESNPVEGSTRRREKISCEIPRWVSMEAYRALNYFWANLGMDIDMEDKLPRTSLIEE